MGRGDKKTKRGKISNGSYGKTRPAREIVRKAAAAAKNGTAKKENA
jgi:30S ribosomal protein S31